MAAEAAANPGEPHKIFQARQVMAQFRQTTARR
jgi:hypothetical protein